jgi:hypothetical protein
MLAAAVSLLALPSGFRTDQLPAASFLHQIRYARASDHAHSFAAPGRSPRDLGVGFVHVSIVGDATTRGEAWYRTGDGRYVRAGDIRIVAPSAFRGVVIEEDPRTPFGWVYRDIRAENGAAVPRYMFVRVRESRMKDGREWVRIDDDQWLERDAVRIVTPAAPQFRVGTREKWFLVNLAEQTVTAYEGLRPVYATLISSGLDDWPTRTGQFRVWHRVTREKMSGNPGTSLYYYNADVPYIMYFDKGVALHGAYWHDKFGNQVSHGCVNLPPQDAEWLYRWSRDAPNAKVLVKKERVNASQGRNGQTGR